VIPKNFFTTSNLKHKYTHNRKKFSSKSRTVNSAQFFKLPKINNRAGVSKDNLETRNVFFDFGMTTKRFKPFKSSKRFVSYRYNLVKGTKNLVFLSKL
jgi:hypothetical protein